MVKLNNYLTDTANIAIFREVRDRYVDTVSPPAGTTIQVLALAPEVEAIALLPVSTTSGVASASEKECRSWIGAAYLFHNVLFRELEKVARTTA